MTVRRLTLSGLRTRLLLLVLFALVPMLGLTLYTAFADRRDAAERAENTALRLARVVATNQRQLTDEARELLATAAEAPQVRSEEELACNVYLADLQRRWPRYANLGVIAPDGDVRCSAVPTTGQVNLSDRLYFQQALETRDFAVGEFQIGRITGKASLNFGYPVLDERGRPTAVVFAALDLEWLNQLGRDAQLGAGTTLTMLDEDAKILARYPDPDRWVGQRVQEADLARAVLSGREGVTEVQGLDGVERFHGFTPLPGAPGAGAVFVTAGIPKATILAGPNRKLQRDLAVLALIGALALAAAWAGGHLFLLRPMSALSGVARRLSAGDLRARTGLQEGRGELAELGRTFDEMAASLQEREDELRQLNEELEQRVLERTAELAVVNESLEGQNRELEALYRFGERLASETRLEPLMEVVLEQLADFAGAEVATLYALVGEAGDPLTLTAARGLEPDRLPQRLGAGEGLAGRAFAERRALPVSYGETGLRLATLAGEVAVRHELHVPLVHGERALGVVTLARVAEPGFDDDLETLAHLANQAAVALSNAMAEREAARLKADLAETIENELRRPLASILGFAELLVSRRLDAPARKAYHETIHAEAKRLTGVVEDFLDLQRIGEGTFTIEPGRVELDELLTDEVARLAAEGLREFGLEVTDRPLLVLGERARLAQLVARVLGTVNKHAAEGEGIDIHASSTDGVARVSVQARLRLGGDGGLGLALARGIVQAHEGRIGLDAADGDGSLLWFELPLAPAEQE
jgi:signal transduction histidine kinase/HAMP domain-containing protein